MIAKTLIAAAALAATMTVALPAQEARADVDVDIGIGFFPGYGYGYGTGYGFDDYGYHDGGYGHGYYPERRPYRISCGAGRRIVDNSGFNRVRAVDCELPGYRYVAWKRGHKYMVRVSGRGNITSINRVY